MHGHVRRERLAPGLRALHPAPVNGFGPPGVYGSKTPRDLCRLVRYEIARGHGKVFMHAMQGMKAGRSIQR